MCEGKGGHDEERGGRAVRRMGDAVGIISKRPLYPAARTERPVCVCGRPYVFHWLDFAPVVPGAAVLRAHILTSTKVSQPASQDPT